MTSEDSRQQALYRLHRDRRLAHRIIFAAGHKNRTPPFHEEMIRFLHGNHRNVCIIGFRGSAKSTLAEEAVVIRAAFREFRHCLIVGSSFDRAAERLHAIRRHLEKNETLLDLFGSLRGAPWGDDKLELSTGVTIQALGRGQALRGTKTESIRPDLIVCDDIEDLETVKTPEGREKIQGWFFSELLPAGDDPSLMVRVLANDMHPECLANKLKPATSGFTVRVYPWEFKDPDTGERTATWEDRFPLKAIDERRRQLYGLGRAAEYEREYMCHSESPEGKPFKPEMRKVEPQIRTWQAVYSMKDPARKVGAGAAMTGSATWSWIANRLIVWDMWARPLMPDQIIDSLFTEYEQYHPVSQGFEEDGLNEWALQPIRQEQAKRGMMLPLRPLRAPKGKLDFIKGLQPYFNAREIIFASEFPEAWAQFLGFPTGFIDAPNALAYALRMRPGAPIYDGFTQQNIAEGLRPQVSRPVYLALNATPALLTGVLVQYLDGALRVYSDWVREGDPGAMLPDLLREATLEAGRNVTLLCPPHHFDRFNNFGLVQAARRVPVEIRPAAQSGGQEEVRRLLGVQARGMPALLVASGATWTLNAMAGGYARALLKGGQLADFAEEGPYRVLTEGLESLCGLMGASMGDDEDGGPNYATSASGKRYLTARPDGSGGVKDVKVSDMQALLAGRR